MKKINLITIGQLKDKDLLSIEQNYSKQIKSFQLNIHEIKSQSEKVDTEADIVIKKINKIANGKLSHIILLMETGKQMNSHQFSSWLFDHLANTNKDIFFIIGGAAGFGDKLINKANEKISLSGLTFPHKIARVLLIEQIYRAQTIHIGHPYHRQ